MTNLLIAYALIAITLIAYGISLYRRTRTVETSLRALEKKD